MYLGSANLDTAGAKEEDLAMIAQSAVSAATEQKNAHKALRLLEEAKRLHAGVDIDLCTVQVILSESCLFPLGLVLKAEQFKAGTDSFRKGSIASGWYVISRAD